jgi:uncharacterized cupredoxin-like copper-binding protein
MKTKYLPFILVFLSLGSSVRAADSPQKISVSLTDHSIALDVGTVKPGKVVFEITNGLDSKFEHEFVVLRSELEPTNLPVKDGKVEEEKVKNVGEIEGIKPGKVKRLALNLREGHYSIICNVTGHYEMGMNTSLVVAK